MSSPPNALRAASSSSAAGQHDIAALIRQRERDAGPDAAARAGDERGLSKQA
jgi:hypothetical protein